MGILIRQSQINPFLRWSPTGTDVSWKYTENHLDALREAGLDLDPEIQRGHVWTEAQQISYIEFKIRGGYGADIILLNQYGRYGKLVLVDGKQRLEAVRKFMRQELRVFQNLVPGGALHTEIEWQPLDCRLRFCENNLTKEWEVADWYLQFNSGGTPHSAEELRRVRQLRDLWKKQDI